MQTKINSQTIADQNKERETSSPYTSAIISLNTNHKGPVNEPLKMNRLEPE